MKKSEYDDALKLKFAEDYIVILRLTSGLAVLFYSVEFSIFFISLFSEPLHRGHSRGENGCARLSDSPLWQPCTPPVDRRV